jgi:hypothetical protein
MWSTQIGRDHGSNIGSVTISPVTGLYKPIWCVAPLNVISLLAAQGGVVSDKRFGTHHLHCVASQSIWNPSCSACSAVGYALRPVLVCAFMIISFRFLCTHLSLDIADICFWTSLVIETEVKQYPTHLQNLNLCSPSANCSRSLLVEFFRKWRF